MDLVRRTLHNHSNGQAHHHNALDPTKNEIRLLRLLPAISRASRITGELFVISLEDDPLRKYEALSYVWGDPAKAADIWIDGRRLGITKNLEMALKDIRPRLKPLTIWIDAVCIDQGNPEERGHQVQLMRKVYSKAVCTRAWLDVEVDVSSAPFREIKTHGSRIDLGDYSVDFWNPLTRVFLNEYFTRLWVQQEMLLASNLMFNFRRSRLASPHIFPFLSTLVQNGGNPTNTTQLHRALEIVTKITNANDVVGTDMIRIYHDQPRTSPKFSLLRLFLGSDGLECRDIRDHLFGFLGMANDITPEDITIDYDLDPIVLFAQIPSAFIHRHNDLAFLAYRQPTRRPSLSKGKISVFSKTPTWFPIPGHKDYFAGSPHASSVGCLPRRPPGLLTIGATVNIAENGAMFLLAKGIKIDSVSKTAQHDDIEFASAAELLEDLSTMMSIPTLTSGPQHKDNFPPSSSTLDILSDYILHVLHHYYPRDAVEGGALGGLPNTEQWKMPYYLGFLLSIAKRTNQPNLTINNLRWDGELGGVLTPTDFDIADDLWKLFETRRFLSTSNHGIALARSQAGIRVGDEIWLLIGCPIPLILRPREGGGHRVTFLSASAG